MPEKQSAFMRICRQPPPIEQIMHFLKPHLSIFLASFLFCTPNQSGNIFFIDQIDQVDNNPNTQFRDLAKEGLEAWDLGLNTNVLGTLRNITPGHAANPPNWITTASEGDCSAKGIPLSLRKSGEECILSGDTIGFCWLSWLVGNTPESGQIIDSTTVIEREILNEHTDEAKRAVFIHEIGHCLGLQHWGLEAPPPEKYEAEPGNMSQHETHIMYPSLTEQTPSAPHSSELNAIKKIYQDENGCSSRSRPDVNCKSPCDLANAAQCGTAGHSHSQYEGYYPCHYERASETSTCQNSHSNSQVVSRIYQSRFPVFTISASIGNAYTHEEMPPPGPPLKGRIVTQIFKIKADGSEEQIRLDDDGP